MLFQPTSSDEVRDLRIDVTFFCVCLVFSPCYICLFRTAWKTFTVCQIAKTQDHNLYTKWSVAYTHLFFYLQSQIGQSHAGVECSVPNSFTVWSSSSNWRYWVNLLITVVTSRCSYELHLSTIYTKANTVKYTTQHHTMGLVMLATWDPHQTYKILYQWWIWQFGS